jgi:uncharacterized cupin superfamily protein
MADDGGPKFMFLDQLDWVDERNESNAPIEVIEASERAGVRRKIVTRGDGGFYAHMSEIPAGYEVARHSHDHDELIIVIDGSCTFLDGGPTLKAFDTAVLRAGHEYGFTAGPEGLRFFNIRQGKAKLAMSSAASRGSAS